MLLQVLRRPKVEPRQRCSGSATPGAVVLQPAQELSDHVTHAGLVHSLENSFGGCPCRRRNPGVLQKAVLTHGMGARMRAHRRTSELHALSKGGMISGRCGGSAAPDTSASAPRVCAENAVRGGVAMRGSTLDSSLGCAFRTWQQNPHVSADRHQAWKRMTRTCLRPSSAFRSPSSDASRAGRISDEASAPPPLPRNIWLNAAPAALRTAAESSHSACCTVGMSKP